MQTIIFFPLLLLCSDTSPFLKETQSFNGGTESSGPRLETDGIPQLGGWSLKSIIIIKNLDIVKPWLLCAQLD